MGNGNSRKHRLSRQILSKDELTLSCFENSHADGLTFTRISDRLNSFSDCKTIEEFCSQAISLSAVLLSWKKAGFFMKSEDGGLRQMNGVEVFAEDGELFAAWNDLESSNKCLSVSQAGNEYLPIRRGGLIAMMGFAGESASLVKPKFIEGFFSFLSSTLSLSWEKMQIRSEIKNKETQRISKDHRVIRQMIREAPVAMAMFSREFKMIAKSRLCQKGGPLCTHMKGSLKEAMEKSLRGEVTAARFEVNDEGDGVPQYYKIVVGPWQDENGEVGGCIVVANPINELVHEKEKALEKSKRKSLFLANMSHEIRTPMNGIIGLIDLLKKTSLSPLQKEYLDTISASAGNLLEIVNDILDFSKIEAGKIQVQSKWSSVHEIFQDSLRSFKHMAKGKNIEFIFENRIPEDGEMEVDPLRLRQIMANLVSNAVKFTAHGFVKVEVESRALADDQMMLSLKVSDSGIGICPEKVRNIFVPFSQADQGIERQFGGTGLGLSITKALVEMMHGTLHVESKLGHGSLFTIQMKVPFRKSYLAPVIPLREKVKNKNSEFGGLKVLVAEDNDLNCHVMGLMLKDLGIRHEFVRNGLEALRLVGRDSSYNLLFLDCEMPVMNGFDAAKEIRFNEKVQKRKPLRIVALTAHAFAEEQKRCFDAGMDRFLGKPITLESLRNILEEEALHLDREKIKQEA